MIGNNINRIRKKKNLTLSELAERSDVSKSYLSNIERNLNDNPSIQIVEKLAEVLEVEVVTLLGEEDQPFTNDEEWIKFVDNLKSLGITKPDFDEYRIVFEFIKWKNQKDAKK
ncbi:MULTISPECIES: helix-turn-helix domain-containing protein [Gracilibacillus]|uniref:Helix-turn-helix domain-containing protein n=1 Tax=Gracilibacillus thailandensis TaxID=563735 RepID=A0A6N7QY27_9BACI|nr:MULTISPECIES: helix-turn-helix transcriptional regulator [Gracilibacillus]MRI65785.1 helix-turn-helix domain-containing protein [Gracilibacillus thailandensis]